MPCANSSAKRRRGIKLIDLGCMQINHHYHNPRRNFESPAHMLDPALNVEYAARFLRELRDREGDWTRAVARYHAGRANTPRPETLRLRRHPPHGRNRIRAMDGECRGRFCG